MTECILAPIDNSAIAHLALAEASALACRLGARLRVLHVVDLRRLIASGEYYAPSDALLARWRAEGESMVAESLKRLGDTGVQIDCVIRCDPGLRICDAILQEAASCDASMIVMGTHGRRGLSRLALGSEAEAVVRESDVPVLLVSGSQRLAATRG